MTPQLSDTLTHHKWLKPLRDNDVWYQVITARKMYLLPRVNLRRVVGFKRFSWL